MIALLLAGLFIVAALSTSVSLADSALRSRNAFKALKRERALVKAGFVPQVEAQQVRLRHSTSGYRGSATRPFARRLPQMPPQPTNAAAA